jgi:hypothetical protein
MIIQIKARPVTKSAIRKMNLMPETSGRLAEAPATSSVPRGGYEKAS